MRKLTSAHSAAMTLSDSPLVGRAENSTTTPSRLMRLGSTATAADSAAAVSEPGASARVCVVLTLVVSVSPLQAVNNPVAISKASVA